MRVAGSRHIEIYNLRSNGGSVAIHKPLVIRYGLPAHQPAKHLHLHRNTSQGIPLDMSARYERLPTSPSNDNELDSFSEELESRLHSNSSSQQHSSLRELHQQLHADPRFSPPSPPRWQRLALIVVVALLYWLAYRMPRAGVPALMDA